MFGQLLKSIKNLFCGAPSSPTVGTDHTQQDGHLNQQYPPQGHQTSPPPGKSQHTPSPLPPKKYQDANQINQSNEYYISLRAQANEHGDQMTKCFQQSHEAYSRRDGALAKELSNQGKENQQKMEKLNKQASDFIYAENNKDSKPGEIDLHGLYVKEAIARADEAIKDAKAHGMTCISLIVGKGLHSNGGLAKIKPAIEDLIRKHKLQAQLDPDNSGVLIVLINPAPGQRGIGADEITQRLERRDESCTIM